MHIRGKHISSYVLFLKDIKVPKTIKSDTDFFFSSCKHSNMADNNK